MTTKQISEQRKQAIALKCLARAEATLADTPGGRRDTALGEMIKDAGKFYPDYLSEQQITDAAVRACIQNGLDQDTKNGGIEKVRRDVPRCLAANKDLTVDWDRFDWLAAESEPRRNGVDLDPSTDDAPTDIAELESGFWVERQSLQDIFFAALSGMASPWAVLACCAARALALVRPHVKLPALIGATGGSLNWMAAIVAESSGGKGTALDVARMLVESPVLQRNAGSGEGMVGAYLRDRTDDEPAGLHESIMLVIDEIDTLTAMNSRSGSTTLSTLRSAFFAEQLGFSYANKKTPNLDPHSYRMTVVMGVQPARAGVLLDDAHGGTPQRVMWFPATDRRISVDLAGGFIAPLTVPAQSEWLYPTTLAVPDEASQLIREARAKSARGETNPLDGHALFAREKFAYALALLDGRAVMTVEDWELSGIAAKVSDHTRARVIAALESAAAEESVKRGTQQGIAADAAGVSKAEAEWKRTNRRASWIVGKLKEAGQQGMSEGELRDVARSTDRQSIRAVLDTLADQGVVTGLERQSGDRTDRWGLAE